MSAPWLDLTGRAAIVTGCGSPTGIGFATARALGELGASLLITSTTDRIHQRADELAALGITAVGITADLTSEEDAAAVLGVCVAEFNHVDILVNNAGMTSVGSVRTGGNAESGSTADLSVEEWHTALARNLDTAFLMSRAVLPQMRLSGHGRIVNVVSVTGPVMAMRGEAAYATAKSALVGLTRSLALDEAQWNITANAIAPGWIATGSQTEDEARQGLATPIKRSGTPLEIAAVIATLCTDAASYLTGQCITVDGGNSIAEERA